MKRVSRFALLLATMSLAGAIACASEDGSSESAADVKKPAASAAAGAPASAAVIDRGRTLYKANCVACHGESGKGDGPGAGVFKPPPRDHTDRAYMSTLTDKDLGDVIRMGGAMRGKPLMPSNPQINGDELAALVAYVRSLSQPAP